jgi:hypothetical protein
VRAANGTLSPLYRCAVNKPGEALMPPVRPTTARPAAALPDEGRAAWYAFEPRFDRWLD